MKTFLNTTVTLILLVISLNSAAQELTFDKGQKYILGDITVTGNTNFSDQTVVSYSGLRKGQEVTIPGEQISNALKKLWNSKLFSAIDIYLTRTENNVAYLEIYLVDLPELNEVTIEGVRKSKKENIIKDNQLTKGVKVTENLITTTRNYLVNKYKKDGYFKTKVTVTTKEVEDSIQKRRVNMKVDIDRGDKVKIKQIAFIGNEKLSDKKLRKAMKKTKQKNPIRIFKRSKYVANDYKTDLVSVIDTYKENGYRDARILSDSIIYNADETISLAINLEEGEKYTFGKITFVGNSVYTDKQLQSILRINEGDTYNGVELKKRIADDTKPDAVDIANLYQNSGYLFSSVNPVEVSADGNVIDMEIRISEGKPAYFNNVTVVGNEKTNDHVIYRELRTRPGQLYSKDNVIRTIREIGQMGFFDAQKISPNFKNVNPTDGTVD
ncbi:MAG TPA: POTRA domain-containing protein, partial [Aquaticitalea sp.]|nr:POTRA domain-containing protein [Aquaticitalea sp.]